MRKQWKQWKTILRGSKITADGDCSHEIKRRLLLGRKVMTNLDNILKSRDITNKGLSSQSYGFSSSHVWMWELDYKETWAPQNWCIWTVVLEKTLKGPWTARKSNQSILKEINPEYSLEWLMLNLELLYFGHLMRTDSVKDPNAGKHWSQKEKEMTEDEMVGWTWVWISSRSWWWTGKPGVLQSMGSQRVDMTEGLNWTELVWSLSKIQTSWSVKSSGP